MPSIALLSLVPLAASIEVRSQSGFLAPVASNVAISSNVTSKQVPVGTPVTMPMEQQMFDMSPEMITHMMQELTVPGPVNDAVNFVRTHPNEGWAWCANDGAACNCVGNVRYGRHDGGWPEFTLPKRVDGSVMCQQPQFAGTVTPGHNGYHCQCSSDAERSWQGLKLRFNSQSYLQEAWVTLTRVLSQANMLPIAGRIHAQEQVSGEALFSGRGGGSQDRTYMDMFIRDSLAYLPAAPTSCFEWGPEWYLKDFPMCANSQQLVLQYEGDTTKMRIEGKNVYGDNLHLPQILGATGTLIDVAIATNVWEHEKDPFEAAAALFSVMKPGGIIVFTVPFTSPYHGVPFDFFRYTKGGVKHVFEKAGFCVPNSRMASGGNFVNDIAMMSGMSPGDFSPEEINKNYIWGYDNIPDGAVVIFSIMNKPHPGEACMI